MDVECGAGNKKSLQVLKNKVAQIVTGPDLITPSKALLEQCGLLNLNQMIFFRSVLLMFKV